MSDPDLGVADRPHLDLIASASYGEDRHVRYAWFRDHEPVAWDATNRLWGVFRYDDVVTVETRDDIFVSSDQHKGGYRPNIPADPSIIGLDNPEHARRRKLVSRRFTPRAVAAREERVRQVVGELLDAALARGTVDIVGELAAVLPARMIGWLLGFPDDAWPRLADWSERTIVLGGGPQYFNPDGFAATIEFGEAATGVYAERQRCPADDILSLWATASDGNPMDEREVMSDCLLLLDGGAETTRTVIARSMLELIARPDQWQALTDGADLRVATEEFIRWVSPLHNMCRVAARDVDLGGTTVHAGDQVVLMYASANRDPRHFANPETFDVRRSPNNHIAFGLGTHFCLGAGLARLEIRVFFEELVRRVAGMALVSEPVDIRNAFVHGLGEARVTLHAREHSERR